jgi:hypothetical protein
VSDNPRFKISLATPCSPAMNTGVGLSWSILRKIFNFVLFISNADSPYAYTSSRGEGRVWLRVPTLGCPLAKQFTWALNHGPFIHGVISYENHER